MTHADTILEVFKAHGIKAARHPRRLDGPQVERQLFSVPVGTRVAKVVGLTDEVEMALGLSGVSITRQGSYIAVDVPRKQRLFVDWAPLGTRGLEFFAGLDLQGNARRVDLAAAPHMLIAGSTGSGKSVAINAILTDWLTRLGPEDVRLHIIDPKRVELGQYRKLPQVESFAAGAGWEAQHVVTAVETIMDQRFKLFERHNCRDLEEWNEITAQAPLPFQVLVVDEFADLMLDKVSGKEIEKMIVRIAQLGRAAGVHMLLATQRPSMQVFTGLIKANVPARWVFRVNSGVDSRIALDEMGAEDLLGKGDSLLALPGQPTVRLQSASPSADDMAAVLEYGALLHPDMDERPATSLEAAQGVEGHVNIVGEELAHLLEGEEYAPRDTQRITPMTDEEFAAYEAEADAALEAELQSELTEEN